MASEATTATATATPSVGEGEMKALVLTEKGSLDNFKVTSHPKPKPGPKDVLVKIKATALNPVDWKMAKMGFLIESLPAVLGADLAGVVEEVGSEVTDLKVGDAVTGFNHLGRTGRGTFAEYCIMDENLCANPKPKNISFEEAAGLGIPLLTAAMGCFQEELLALPGSPGKPVSGEPLVLVWGGSSSVGIMIIQLLSQSGYKVVTTASKHNFELVTKAGAAHVVDYRDDDAEDQLRSIVGDNLHIAYDTISSASADKCAKLLTGTADSPAKLAYIAGAPTSAPDTVKLSNVFLGDAATSATKGPWVANWFRTVATPLLEEGTLKCHDIEKLEGLEAIIDGLKRLADHKVSAKKLVATLA